MSRTEKRGSTKSTHSTIQPSVVGSGIPVDARRRAGSIKAGWSEPERRQRALIGQIKRNQLMELCFGKAVAGHGAAWRQRVVSW